MDKDSDDDDSQIEEVPGKDYKSIFHKYAEFESQFQPDDQVFKYVWVFLYITYIISLSTSRSSVGSFVSLIIGLVLNISWIIAYLYFKTPTPSLVILSFMILFAVDSIFRLFKAKKRVQGVFISIYLIWLVFAFYMNFVITRNYYLTFPLENAKIN